jgi:hypothetical protein
LAIAKNAPGISLKSAGEYFLGAEVEDDFLGGIAKDLFELEAPLVLLMVDDAGLEGSLDMDVDVTN